MKKKKEFFRIRKDRKRKNGANARVCTYTATVCRFSDKRGESQPTTEKKPVDGFFIPTRVLFSKQRWKARVLFSKLASKWESPSRSPYARACVCICTQTHPPPTPENSQERRVCPFQALQGTYKPFYGRDR